MNISALFTLLGFAANSAFGTIYNLNNNIVGSGFYDAFAFETIADPTHGRVNYVDQNSAIAQNLTYANGNIFILRADDTTVLNPSGPGRNSVRLKSVNSYINTVLVFDMRHMPQGCGTWPAIWTVGPNWPNGGEIDIVEGVNDQSPNTATLHTGEGCAMPGSDDQLGSTVNTDCNVQINGNAGCGVRFPTAQSYGTSFNSIGGGWYAMERSNACIRVWFWPRNGAVPSDVRSGASSVETENWGTPSALFPNTSCDIDNYFAAQNIVINLTFCGDWAGSVYGSSGCPGTCVDHVNNDPGAFTNAYFDFASLNIYI
ncbi:hypothetical protein AX14_014249 [Amanita brunnescens Koide BX004]|nr:hypothetical protein AX14_014249 [Amanita brunnescens Koide BX004]